MDFFELIERRQSVRAYKSQAVDESSLRKILESVNKAPSAGNFQAYEVFVVKREGLADLTAATFGQSFLAQADLALVFCTNASRCEYDNPSHWAIQDASIAATYAMLALEALGLATCWIGAFLPDKVAALIKAPEGVVPMAILPIGVANENPERTSRRPLDQIVHRVS